MANVAVFSNNILERDLATGSGSLGDQGRLCWKPPVPNTDCQATPVTFLDDRKDWLIAGIKKLSRLACLADDWDSYGAEAPNPISVDMARETLRDLAEVDFEPTSIDPSVEGGICLSFHRGNRYGDIECFNSGKVLAVTSIGGDETHVWEVKESIQGVHGTVSKIRLVVES